MARSYESGRHCTLASPKVKIAYLTVESCSNLGHHLKWVIKNWSNIGHIAKEGCRVTHGEVWAGVCCRLPWTSEIAVALQARYIALMHVHIHLTPWACIHMTSALGLLTVHSSHCYNL